MPKALFSARRAVVFCLALLTLTIPSFAARVEDQGPTPPLAGIAHVAIRVRSLAASIAFYNKLGFQQAFDLRKNDVPYESFIKINDHQFIELYPVDAKNPDPAFLHLCFEGNDLNAIHDDYVSRGLTPNAVRKAGAGNLLFTMRGPENQNIEYTQYEPGSLHSNDRGLHLGPDRVADSLITVSLAMHDTDAARDFYLNQLLFKSLPGQPFFLHLPGDSGQQVEVTPFDAITTRARITLHTSNIAHAARLLHKQQVAFLKSNDTLTITDPDGNMLMIRTE